MPSEVKLENFWIMKNSKIWKKWYAEQSEAKKYTEKLNRVQNAQFCGLKTWGQGTCACAWNIPYLFICRIVIVTLE